MSGYSFELKNHYRGDQNTNYVVTEVRHFASAGQSYTTAGTQGGETYSNHLTCIPASVTYRPARVTPKPFVQGPQPALVVGKAGEEIWVDKYGRVIVQFYWDRLGKKNENSSCWIRTSQPWAGGNWGAMWIPRIGQEVLVSFLEGDPGPARHNGARLQREPDASLYSARLPDAKYIHVAQFEGRRRFRL